MNLLKLVFLLLIFFGAILFFKCFRKGHELDIRVAMDEADNSAFQAVMHALELPGLLGVRYSDDTDVILMVITVRKHSYKKYIEELKKIPRIEVI